MKIAFFDLEDWEIDYLKRKIGKKHKLMFFKEKIDSKMINKTKDVDIIGVFIHSCIDKSIINNLTKLKYIIAMSTGYDNIDLSYCKKKGIKVSNIPFYGTNTVAEHTFGLILTLSRKLH